MMWWVLSGLALFVAAILLESWRQSRQLRRRGASSRGRGSLMATGILELQGHLQPDRKVEEMRAAAQDRERANPAYRLGPAADGKKDVE